MNDSSEQDFTELLAYQQTDSGENFVAHVIEKVTHKRKFRRPILMFAGAGATLTTALLVSMSKASNWDAIASFISQSPMLIFGAISIGLLSGLLLRADAN